MIIASGQEPNEAIVDAQSRSLRVSLYDLLGHDISADHPLPVQVMGGSLGSSGGSSSQSTGAPSSTVSVSNFPTTQAISAANLPLPSGAATEASLAALADKIVATPSGLKIDGSAFTQPVSAVSLPLPSGAATETTLGALSAKLSSTANGLKVDNSGNTQPISGSVSVSNLPVTQPVSVGSLPLPAGAATAALQTSGNTSLSSLDSKFPGLGQALMANSLPVAIASNQGALATTVGNFPASQAVTVAALPLPSGAATSSAQATGNSSLSSLDGKFPSLGQAAMAASLPVTLANNQSTLPVSVGNFPNTQAISATSLPLPSGAATETTLSGLSAKFSATVNGLKVDGSGVTQPISASALPLPSGAATSALQTSGNASLTSVDSKLPALGQAAMAASVPVVLASNQSALATSVANFPATQAVSAATLPLPSGAATDSTLAALSAKFGSLGQKTSANSTPVVLASDQGSFNVSVSNFPATQPVSAAALPLPSGAATESTLSALSGKFGSLGQKVSAGSTPVVLASDQSAIAASISNFPSTQAVSAASLPLPNGAATETTLSGLSGKFTSTANGLKVDGSGATQPISASALPLPSGAATSALQTSGNASLSSVDSKLPAQGQALMAASVPVVLASNQSALSTSVSNFPATQAVSATALPLPSGAATDSTLAALSAKFGSLGQKTSANSAPVVLASDQGSFNVSVSNFPATQPVSAAALPLPSGAATESTLSALNGKFGSLGQKASAGSTPVVLASDQSAISASISNFPSTQAVSAASLPLPSGASTESTLAALSAKFGSLGQKTSANSTPVVLASDQGSFNVAVSNFPATQAVSATALPLPSGAATSAAQGTGNSSLSSIDTKTPALGQALMAASVPVTLASNQSALSVSVGNFPATQAVSAAALPLPSGASTESTLAALSAKFSALGQKTAANSTPVVLASDQGGLSVSVANFPSTQAVSAASLPLPSGAATESSLSALLGRFSSLGQKASTASTPVVVASDQSALTVSVNNFPASSGGSSALSTVKTGQSSVTTTATQLAATALSGRLTLIATAMQGNTGPIFLGPSTVTASNGMPLYPGQSLSLDLGATGTLYAIVASGSQTLALLEAA